VPEVAAVGQGAGEEPDAGVPGMDRRWLPTLRPEGSPAASGAPVVPEPGAGPGQGARPAVTGASPPGRTGTPRCAHGSRQSVTALLPRSVLLGPSAVGRMSKSKMAVGRYSEQQALGMSTTPLMRPSIGAAPSSR